MIHLRKLKPEDAKPMLEWMLDPDIYGKMQYNPKAQTTETCMEFIRKSWTDAHNRHYAIADEQDAYLGTVSLKNIDDKNRNAEFAIAVRKQVMGTGASGQALQEILKIAFEQLKLHKVYLYVRTDNERAIRFYEKNHLNKEGQFKEHIFADGSYKDIIWYSITEDCYREQNM